MSKSGYRGGVSFRMIPFYPPIDKARWDWLESVCRPCLGTGTLQSRSDFMHSVTIDTQCRCEAGTRWAAQRRLAWGGGR